MFKFLTGKTPQPSKKDFEFKMQYSFDKRKEESTRIREKYPEKIPIIVEKSDNSTVSDISNHKFLIASELTVGQFIYVIRKKIQISSTDGLFFYIDNHIIPKTSDMISTIYEAHKDKDGFLYITYSSENTFG